MKEHLYNYRDELIKKRIEFERILRVIEKNGLHQIIERDFNFLINYMRELNNEQQDELIEMLLNHSSEDFRMEGFTEDDISNINRKIHDNFKIILKSGKKISFEELHDRSISAWKIHEKKLKDEIEHKQRRLNRIKNIGDKIKSFIAGSTLVYLDLRTLKQTMNHGATVSLVVSFSYFADIFVKK
jgi:hypothetical protein